VPNFKVLTAIFYQQCVVVTDRTNYEHILILQHSSGLYRKKWGRAKRPDVVEGVTLQASREYRTNRAVPGGEPAWLFTPDEPQNCKAAVGRRDLKIIPSENRLF
jgi:hypothetical protein